jgi:hypothetical protein
MPAEKHTPDVIIAIFNRLVTHPHCEIKSTAREFWPKARSNRTGHAACISALMELNSENFLSTDDEKNAGLPIAAHRCAFGHSASHSV